MTSDFHTETRQSPGPADWAMLGGFGKAHRHDTEQVMRGNVWNVHTTAPGTWNRGWAASEVAAVRRFALTYVVL